MSARITAAVLTYQEERHVAACLGGLRWADELLVLDSGSRDRTATLARAAGAVVHTRPFDDYAHQRQAAIELASGDWILFVDADERVAWPLARELRRLADRDAAGAPVGYWIPRRNYIWGRWIRGGGWWPDAQLRFFRRDRAAYDLARPVHELVRIDGPTATTRCALVHYNYETVGQFIAKQRRYAALDAAARRRRGESTRPRRLIGAPTRELWRRYVQLGARRDGWHGARLAVLAALAEAETQVRLLTGRPSGPTSTSLDDAPTD